MAGTSPGVERLLALIDAAFTYPEVGRTAGALPTGYRHIRRRAVVGHGQRAFSTASQALVSWDMHRRAGLTVSATGPLAVPGAVVLLSAGFPPLRLIAPCRVVYEVVAGRRRGFAYGTLPGHPEVGEEAFVLEHSRDDTVEFTITAFARPARWYSRLGRPLTWAAQDFMTWRYAHVLPQM